MKEITRVEGDPDVLYMHWILTTESIRTLMEERSAVEEEE